ncbi:MAG: hypothetical protein JO150_15775, partial [Acidobacteriaceae bacterium]|nr:hypothetical protein [Acidobacteriaceae bacterium]
MLFLGNGAPDDLMRKRGGIAFTEKQEAKEVTDWIAFSPLEISVRIATGCLFQVDERGRNSVRYYWTSSAEDSVLTDPFTGYFQRIFKFRSIAKFQ